MVDAASTNGGCPESGRRYPGFLITIGHDRRETLSVCPYRRRYRQLDPSRGRFGCLTRDKLHSARAPEAIAPRSPWRLPTVGGCPCRMHTYSVVHSSIFRESAHRWKRGSGPKASRIGRTSSGTPPSNSTCTASAAGALQSDVEASEDALANSDIAYFANRLPKREFYRIAASFPETLRISRHRKHGA